MLIFTNLLQVREIQQLTAFVNKMWWFLSVSQNGSVHIAFRLLAIKKAGNGLKELYQNYINRGMFKLVRMYFKFKIRRSLEANFPSVKWIKAIRGEMFMWSSKNGVASNKITIIRRGKVSNGYQLLESMVCFR